MKARVLTILTAVVMTACTKPAPAPEEGAATQPVAEQAAAPDTGAHANMQMGADSTAAPTMSSMDHGKMAAQSSSGATAPPISGMDHSKMQTPPARGTGAMAGMDHARMEPRPATTRPSTARNMSAMDHTRMGRPNAGTQRAAPSTAAQQTMPGMDHAAMGRMTPSSTAPMTSEDAAFEKLRLLVLELMRDPAIQARIENDTALRRLWLNEQVRRAFDRRD